MLENIKFKCKVVIGLGGFAVLDLVEWCPPDWCVEPGTKLEIIKEDIIQDGAQEWCDRLMTDVPCEHGIYNVTGGAYVVFEDNIDYGGVVFEGI